MDKLHEFKEFIEDELEKIRKKGDLTPSELESSYKAIDILKDIEEIKDRKTERQDGEYSGAYHRMPDYGRYYSGEYYPRYSSRRRDSMGRFARSRYSGDGYYRLDGMYSSEDARSAMMEHLRAAADKASNERDRDMILGCMENLD